MEGARVRETYKRECLEEEEDERKKMEYLDGLEMGSLGFILSLKVKGKRRDELQHLSLENEME